MQQIQRDGVTLRYEDAGSGAPPILLVHGVACDHTHLAPQFEHFRRAHRVVSVDLRGHGQSDKPQQDYTLAGLADDLAWLCDALGVYKPVVVGHSMGGVIALDLAARYPDLPAAIAILDAPLFVPAEMAAAVVVPVVMAMRTPGYAEALCQFMASAMLPTDDAERKERILAQMAAAPQHVVAPLFESLGVFDSAAAAAACKVPALFIGAAVPNDLNWFKQLCPQLVVGQSVGAGHWHQLEVPARVNSMLDRFLAIGLPQAVASAPASVSR